MNLESEAQIAEGLRLIQVNEPARADAIWEIAIQKARSDSPKAAAEVTGRIAAAVADLGFLDKAIQYEHSYSDFRRGEKGADLELEMSVETAVGSALFEARRFDEAEPYYRRAADASSGMGDDSRVGLGWGNLGNLLIELGRPQDAILSYKTAAKGYQKCGDTTWQAWMLTSLGCAYEKLKEYDKAIAAHDNALRLSAKVRDHRLRSSILSNLGCCNAELGRLDLAIGLHREALALAVQAQDQAQQEKCERNLRTDFRGPPEEATVLVSIDIGYAHLIAKDHPGAERFFLEAAKNAEQLEKVELGQVAWGLLAQELIQNGKLNDAEYALWKQIDAARSVGNTRFVVSAWGQIAEVFKRRGEYALAFRCWELQTRQRNAIREITLSSCIERSEAYIRLGNWRSARQLLSIAERAVGKLKDDYLLSRYERCIAEVALLKGKLDEAEDHLNSALALVQRDSPEMLDDETNAQDFAFVSHPKGLQQPAADRFDMLPVAIYEGPERVDNALSTSRLRLAQGRLEDGRNILEKALEWALLNGDKNREISARYSLGEVLLRKGRLGQALEQFTSTVRDAQTLGHLPYVGLGLAGEAEVYMQKGEFAEANQLLEAAIEAQKDIAVGLDDDSSVSLLQQQQRSYELLQACLIAQGKPEQALVACERLKARALAHVVERRHGSGARAMSMKSVIQTAALESFFLADVGQHKGPSFRIDPLNRANILRKLGLTALDRVVVEDLSIEDMQAICHQLNMVVVSYSLLATDDLHAWIISEDFIHFLPLHRGDSDGVRELTTRLRGMLAAEGRGLSKSKVGKDSEKFSHDLCREAYKMLIEPLADYLPTGKRKILGIVPSGSLFSIPFPALVDESGRTLIDKYRLVTSPSIRFWRQTQQLGSAGNEAIVIGNPMMPDLRSWLGEDGISLESLHFAQMEAGDVSKILRKNGFKVFRPTRKMATKQTLLERLKTARIVHIATHALLDQDNPNRSAIALAPIGKDNGFLTAGEVSEIDTRAELVVLSSCKTGAGEVTGDGVMGLARAWHVAGARTVVFSLWSVNDKATASFMKHFYQAMGNGDYAEALQAAARETRQQFPNPLDWAGFAISGQALALSD